MTRWLGLKESGFQVGQGPLSQILTSPLQHQGSLEVLQEERHSEPVSPLSSHPGPGAQITMVQQIADNFLTASADCMVQECAALLVPVHEVTSCLV